jgi:hypothetical protein
MSFYSICQCQARARIGRSGVVFIAVLSLYSPAAHIQSSPTTLTASQSDRLSQVDDGVASRDEYQNQGLGLRYQFPRGWNVNNRASQKKTLEARRQFVWADDMTPNNEKNSAHHYSKGLLLVTQYPEEMRLDGFNPVAFLIVADPNCIPGSSFPKTVKENEAIQRIASHLGTYFKTLPLTSTSTPRIRAFDNGGRVMLEISDSFSMNTREPGRESFRTVRSSVVVAQARDYWVMWMFASDNDIQLDQMRKSKIFLDTTLADQPK